MAQTQDSVEDRVFELLDTHSTREIASEIGLGVSETAHIACKVLKERGTPNFVAIEESLKRLEKLIEQI